MIPMSFDADTSREMLGDERARKIEAKARADADIGVYDEPCGSGESYWSRVQMQFERSVYFAQFKRRSARNERKKEPMK